MGTWWTYSYRDRRYLLVSSATLPGVGWWCRSWMNVNVSQTINTFFPTHQFCLHCSTAIMPIMDMICYLSDWLVVCPLLLHLMNILRSFSLRISTHLVTSSSGICLQCHDYTNTTQKGTNSIPVVMPVGSFVICRGYDYMNRTNPYKCCKVTTPYQSDRHLVQLWSSSQRISIQMPLSLPWPCFEPFQAMSAVIDSAIV